MNNITIETSQNPSPEDIRIIDEGIYNYNNKMLGPQEYIPVTLFARDEGKVIGGLKGNLFWDYLYVDILWIDEKYRRSGIGKQLMNQAESLALEKGITRSHLCTATFQSVDFYKALGYSVFGKLEDMPKGETEYYMHKRLKQ